MAKNKFKITPVELLSDSKINIKTIGGKSFFVPLKKGSIIGLDKNLLNQDFFKIEKIKIKKLKGW